MYRRPLVFAMLLTFVAPCTAGNFTGDAAYVNRAEAVRGELARFWMGEELPAWAKPCPIKSKVSPNTVLKKSSGGGATAFAFHEGEVFGWSMSVYGPHERIMDSVLPHEVNHMVLATIVRRKIPRWLDEGTSTLFEHTTEHHRQRLLVKQLYKHPWSTFRKFDYTGEYPFSDMKAVQAMYSTGFSVVEWLLAIGGKDRLLAFIKDPRPPTKKFSSYYGMNLIVAEQKWIDWMLPRGTACPECECYIHTRDYTTTAKPVFVEGRPTLYAVGNAFCLACIPYANDYRRDRQFRAALQSRANIVPIDGMQHVQWLRGLGITGWPAYVLKLHGQYYVVATNYPGKAGLIAAIDRTIAQNATPVVAESGQDDAPMPPRKTEPIELPPLQPEDPPAASLAIKKSTTPGPNDPIVTNTKQEPPAQIPDKTVPQKTSGAQGWSLFKDFSWGGVAIGVLGAFGVVVPVWAVWAWRAAKAAKRLRVMLHNRPAPPQQQPTQAPVISGLENPEDRANVYQNTGARYPGANDTIHYTVDAPQRTTHRVNQQFVNVQSDSYRDAHAQARVETARRYPGSQEILETELSLINQFIAGQYPAK